MFALSQLGPVCRYILMLLIQSKGATWPFMDKMQIGKKQGLCKTNKRHKNKEKHCILTPLHTFQPFDLQYFYETFFSSFLWLSLLPLSSSVLLWDSLQKQKIIFTPVLFTPSFTQHSVLLLLSFFIFHVCLFNALPSQSSIINTFGVFKRDRLEMR